MDYQQNILNQYRELYGPQTIREMAAQTGIQVTRVFRLFNGSEMKLREYEIFHRLILLKGVEHGRILELAQEATEKLNGQTLRELEQLFERKLKLANFIHGDQMISEQTALAA